MINKPSIIITSLGRTGTKFFARFFQHTVPNVTSLHEPDIFTTADVRSEGLSHIFAQVRDAGTRNLLLKLIGRWSVIEISDARVRSELSAEESAERLIVQRDRFISSKPGNLYVEATTAYYGLLDILDNAFRNVRSVYIVRDGRDWLRSNMAWIDRGGLYNKGRVRTFFAHTWPTAAEFEGDPYRERWPEMSRFEKMCWAWAKLNGYALRTTENTPSARLFRFEDIFLSKDRNAYLEELVAHLAALDGLDFISAEDLKIWVKRPVHQSERRFPSWSDWSPAQRAQFIEICGPLMTHLGYDYD